MANNVRLEVFAKCDIKNPETCQWVQFQKRTYDSIAMPLARAVEQAGKGRIIDELAGTDSYSEGSKG